MMKDKMTDLCGNQLLQGDFTKTFCEINPKRQKTAGGQVNPSCFPGGDGPEMHLSFSLAPEGCCAPYQMFAGTLPNNPLSFR